MIPLMRIGEFLMRIISLIFVLIFSFSCNISMKKKAISDEVALAHIKSNLEFLASDDLEGRLTTARGSRAAAQYIISNLKKYGLAPAGENGSFFQEFNLQHTTFLPDSKFSLFGKDLAFGENYIPFNSAEPAIDSELIYVGHGISDTSLNYDDYKDIDVSGKVVIIMYGVPTKKDDPEFFKDGSRWRRSSKKANTAFKKGAKGAIILGSDYLVNRWDEFKDGLNRGSISKIDSNKIGFNAAWIDTSTAKQVFNLENIKYKELGDTLNAGFLNPGTIISSKVSIDVQSIQKIVIARNVIGLLGKKPTVNNKAILYGTHYDHEGIKGGKIFNGADDNASGTAAMLEVLRQFSMEKRVDRPILFCFWDAEEKGLIGSEYFAENLDDSSKIGFHINADMVGRGAPDSIYIIGTKGVSDEVAEIVSGVNNYPTLINLNFSYDDVNHKDRPYQRSDHWPFAKMNIPFIGLGDKDRVDYHKHTDTADKIILTKVLRTVKFIKAVGLKVANLDHDLKINRVIDFGEK